MKTSILLAIRNIFKTKVNAAITIVGLSVAFASLLLIYLYVSQEFSYNNFHANGDRIFRANYSIKMVDGGATADYNYYDPKLAEVLKEKVPAIKRSTAFRGAHSPLLKFDNQYFQEEIYITEHDFFEMFSFDLIIGNKSQIFSNPDEIVITSSLADKFQAIKNCEKEELIGEPVFFMNTGDQPFIISGILEDIPENSSMQFDALIPYKYERSFRQSNNFLGNSTIFYEINEITDRLSADMLVSKTITDFYKDRLDQLRSQKVIVDSPDAFIPYSTPLENTYLGEIKSDYESSNSKTNLYILSGIGLVISAIAIINFILLSLGQSFKKVNEISIRKVLGAKHSNIFVLFITEGILITFTALIIGAALCFLLLPVFNQLTQKNIYTDLIDISGVIGFAFLLVLIIVLLTSAIPVLKLGKIQPGSLGSNKTGLTSKAFFSRMFITFQYCLSILLIAVTIAVVRQTNYMKFKDTGFHSDNIINLSLYHLSNSEKEALIDKLKNLTGISQITLTDRNYISGRSSDIAVNETGENISIRILRVDENYIPTLDLEVIMGRNFEGGASDQSVIINEKLLSHFNFDGSPIGQMIDIGGQFFRIIGVIKNHHFDSMKEEIQPLVFFSNANKPEQYQFAFIKYNPLQLSEVMSSFKSIWYDTAPGKELSLNFWDEQLNKRYQEEERWSKVIGYAAVIAIIISSLGLFALTLLTTNRRVKEIGIRKVNGAKVWQVMAMLNKDFVTWVVVAFIIATPISWYAVSQWLGNFAFKTELSWWIFALAGMIALGIALLTVSWQSWKAATRNPVDALRYE